MKKIINKSPFFVPGYGLLTRARYHPQRPEDEEHIPRERQSSDHGLRALQCYQTVLWKQVSTKVIREHFALLSLLNTNRSYCTLPYILNNACQVNRVTIFLLLFQVEYSRRSITYT